MVKGGDSERSLVKGLHLNNRLEGVDGRII